MKKPVPGILRWIPLFLSALCLVLLALSFLPSAQDAVTAVGGMLKGSGLRRPEKWFSRIRSALFASAACLAALQLLIILVRKAWEPLERDGLTCTDLFLSDANLLSVLLATAVSVLLTFVLKGRVGNMLFFVVQIFMFAASYFASCFCLTHNRHLRGRCSPAVQLAVAGAVVLWLVINFIPSSAGALWHSSARMRFRYRMPPVIYLAFLTLASLGFWLAIRAASSRAVPAKTNWARIFRPAVSIAYTFILSSLSYVPNIFGDDPYHINGWEGSVFEVLQLAPYDSGHLTSLYGHYGVFYLLPMRLLHLFGVPYNQAIAVLQFLVTAVMLLSAVYVLHRFIRNDAVFFLFLIALGSYVQFGGRAYFQEEPHRVFFGAVVSAVLFWADGKGPLTRACIAGLGLLGAASIFWNPETGIVCMVAISAWLFLTRADFSGGIFTARNRDAFLLAALLIVAELIAAMMLANAYNLLCGGSPIGLEDFLFPLMSGSRIMARLNDPIIGAQSTAFAYFVLFVMAIFFPLVIKFFSLPGRKEEGSPTPQLYAAIAMIGLGLMSYYILKCSRGFLSICHLQFVMLMAGLWRLLDAEGSVRRHVLVKAGRVIVIVLFSSLVLDNITLPEKISLKRAGAWRTDKLESFLEVLKQDLPDGIPGFGQDVPELYAYIDRDVVIHMTEWANLRFWKDLDSRPFEYVSEMLKGYDFFFANVDDVHLVPEAAKFRRIATYQIGQTFAVYAREGKSLNLSPFKGEGTLDSPYLIESRDDLLSLARHVNAGHDYSGIYFRQTADIDLSPVKNWMPVADGGMAFCGNYDGGCHVIKGLSLSKNRLFTGETEDSALFGNLGGRVCNLGIESGSVRGVDYAAAFASSGGKRAVIANCWNRADVHAFEGSAGIAVNFDGTVACCVNFGRISKEFSLYGALDGVCWGGNPDVWECRPMEGEGFDFAAMNALLPEAENSLDLGGMRLIPWKGR